ncbi:hypothetical protein ScPMuIL_008087 [Solemya velum]
MQMVQVAGVELAVTSNRSLNKQSQEKSDKDYPPLTDVKSPEFPCLYGTGHSKWPIRCFAALDFNVNAHQGGCASLLFISNSYGSHDNAGHTTSEILLVRSGFDCNHSALTSICKNHGGNFGCSNGSYVDEEGQLLGELMFGMNHLMLLSNDSKYGNLSNGVFVKGAVQDELCPLPIKVNDSSTTLILCSGQESGVGSAKPVSCIYMIRSGHSKDVFHSLHVKGDDLWKFSVEKGGILHVLGPSNSFYGLYHNRENLHGDFPDRAQTVQTQAFEGDKACKLLDNVAEIGVAVILCSNSNGTEDSTASSVYVAFLGDGQVKSFAHLQGSNGKSYKTNDLWKFEKQGNSLIVIGPPGPCRYALISNNKRTKQEQYFRSVAWQQGPNSQSEDQ